jgi:hypothetical protein
MVPAQAYSQPHSLSINKYYGSERVSGVEFLRSA